MRFKATLVDVNSISSLTKVVSAISKISKSCVVRLTASKIFFIVTDSQLQGGASFWCEIPQNNFCSGYDFVGHTDRNETFFEVAVESMSYAVKSAQNAKILRLKLTQKATACLTFEVALPSLSSKNRSVVHDIPIRIIPSRLWDEYAEPDIPDFQVSLYLPPLRIVKNVVERLKNISNALSWSANNNGDMVLKAKSEMATINISFKDLMQANWKDVQSQQSSLTVTQSTADNNDKKTFYQVTIDNRNLNSFLSGLHLPTEKVVCNIIENEGMQLFFIYDHLSMQLTLPAQNIL